MTHILPTPAAFLAACQPLLGLYDADDSSGDHDHHAEERKGTRQGRYDSDWTQARLAERRAG